MRPLALLPILALLAAPLQAQATKTFIAPSAFAKTMGNQAFNDIPFGRGSGTYQQVWRATDLAKSVKPVRFQGIEFRGSSNSTGQKGYPITIEVILAGHTGPMSSTFAQNLTDPKIVYKRKSLSLGSNGTSFHIKIPFDSGVEYLWDGSSDVVMDLRVHGNGNNSSNFVYFVDSTNSDASVHRLFSSAGPTATTATLSQYQNGLIAQFVYQEGVALNFGDGCKGAGGYVPMAQSNVHPIVGTPFFQIEVVQAPSQAPAILCWGLSDKMWANTIPLPLDLRTLGMPGCTLYVDPYFVWGTATVGGSPGNGKGIIPFPIPAVGSFIGLELFFQWAIYDTSQSRSIPLTWSDGLRVIIG